MMKPKNQESKVEVEEVKEDSQEGSELTKEEVLDIIEGNLNRAYNWIQVLKSN